MFIVQLKFSNNKAQAAHYMEGHNDWIKKGIEDGVFLLVGSLAPNLGGAVIAHNISREELETCLQQDPFVQEDIVETDIIEISPARTDPRLAFLTQT